MLLSEILDTPEDREHMFTLGLETVCDREFVDGLLASFDDILVFEFLQASGEGDRIHVTDGPLELAVAHLADGERVDDGERLDITENLQRPFWTAGGGKLLF